MSRRELPDMLKESKVRVRKYGNKHYSEATNLNNSKLNRNYIPKGFKYLNKRGK